MEEKENDSLGLIKDTYERYFANIRTAREMGYPVEDELTTSIKRRNLECKIGECIGCT